MFLGDNPEGGQLGFRRIRKSIRFCRQSKVRLTQGLECVVEGALGRFYRERFFA